MVWNADKVEILKTMWGGGASASEIGKVVKMSRNAVIGKKSRLGLGPGGSSRSDVEMSKKLQNRNSPFQRRELIQEHLKIPPSSATIGDLEWRDGTPSNCRAVTSQSRNETFYCGKPNEPSQSYCPEHCRAYFTLYRPA